MSIRKRTAKLPQRVSTLKSELEKLEAPPSTGTGTCAEALDAKFASEVLVAAWTDTLVSAAAPSEDLYRPALKRAIIALSATKGGQSRSSKDVARLVVAAGGDHRTELLELRDVMRDLQDAPSNSLFAITGEDLQSTPFVREVCSSFQGALAFFGARALNLPHNSPYSTRVDEFAARIDRLPSAPSLWRELYLRVVMLVSLNRHHPESGANACIIPFGTFTQSIFSSGTGANLAFTESDIRNTLCFLGTSRGDDLDLIVRPMIEVEGGYATSGALLLDSIAPRILQWIHEHGHWQSAITDPFEDRVIHGLRSAGMTAGSVQANGSWRTQRRSAAVANLLLANGGTCPGEIDVVAVDGDELLLFECKSIYPHGRVRNIVGKVSQQDIEGWTANAKEKVKWLEDATGKSVALAGVVVEGCRLVRTDTVGRDEIALMDISVFEEMLTAAARAERRAHIPPV